MNTKFTKLANIVPSQLPAFVQEDYPTFVAFIKAYYEFLDNQGISRNIEYLRDIDTTLPNFVDHLKSELAITAPALANDRFFLKNTKSTYVAKGSRESYECLFRLLYNKNVQIDYPGERVIRASGGEWVQDISFFLRVTEGDVYTLQNDYLYIYTTTTKGAALHRHRVYVKKIQRVESTSDVYEVFISKNFNGDLNPGDSVNYNGVVGTVEKTTSNMSIIKSGSGFKVGQTFHITTSVSSGCVIKVTKVDSVGGILQIEKISFGIGYQKDFYFQLTDTGAEPYVPQSYAIQKDVITDVVDAGIINRTDYYTWTAGSGSYVGQVIGDFYSNNSSEELEQTAAVLHVKLGAIARYPGYYKSSTSLISEDSYIHDGDYYQDFSYILKIDQKLTAYQDAVYSCLHPVGRKLFGDYLIEAEYALEYEISNPVIRILIPQYSESDESVVTDIDELTSFLMNKPLTSSAISGDLKPYYKMIKVLSESIPTPDDSKEYYHFTKVAAPESVNATSFNSYSITKPLPIEYVPTPDDSNEHYSFSKELKDNAISSINIDYGHVQINPYASELYFAEGETLGANNQYTAYLKYRRYFVTDGIADSNIVY